MMFNQIWICNQSTTATLSWSGTATLGVSLANYADPLARAPGWKTGFTVPIPIRQTPFVPSQNYTGICTMTTAYKLGDYIWGFWSIGNWILLHVTSNPLTL